jgi:hypothetical protein
MSICFVNRFPLTKTTLVFAAIVALASGGAYASTVSSFNISTEASGGTPCSMSGSGPGTASCDSTDGFNNRGDATATLTDNSLQLFAGGAHAGSGSAFASITHDDSYAVPVNGPVSALVSLTCENFATLGSIGHFSLGSTNVSPPVESIYTGASQGSGPCSDQNEIHRLPTDFTVSLVATNNIVELHTHIDGNVQPGADFSGDIIVKLTVDGFLDANGNPIAATLLPEPGTFGTFGLALLVGVGMRGRRKLVTALFCYGAVERT